MKTIYIEEGIADHPRVQDIVTRFPGAQRVYCENYKAVFNPKAQNFRQQKQQGESLILASKQGNRVMSAPAGFGIGHLHNYYFSHMLNCPYDCRYCFLQGMYPSANHVLFVNYDDFMQDIKATIEKHGGKDCVFFSGYDADSLAMDGLSDFVPPFLDFFSQHSGATLEFRTKSTQIRSLLKNKPLDNVVVAFSLSPDSIARRVEHKVPSVAKRLDAIAALVSAGWRVGLRFDPLIASATFEVDYKELITQLKAVIPAQALHSISVGALRFPTKMLDTMQALYPKDRLLNFPFEANKGVCSYPLTQEQAMKETLLSMLSDWVDSSKIFTCEAN